MFVNTKRAPNIYDFAMQHFSISICMCVWLVITSQQPDSTVGTEIGEVFHVGQECVCGKQPLYRQREA